MKTPLKSVTTIILFLFASNLQAQINYSYGTLPLTDGNTANVTFSKADDFDNDGDLDILTQYGGAGTAITFWANDGSGTFSNMGTGYFPATLTNVNIANVGTTLGDFDNDGDVDIWLRVSGNNNDLLLANDGSGTFSYGTLPITDGNTTNVALSKAEDFDSDGDLDILTQYGGAGTAITFWANDGSGTFSNMGTGHFPATLTNVNIGNVGTTAGDFDNDGDVDIWLRVSGNNNDLLLSNDGSGIFSYGTLPITDGNTTNVALSKAEDFDSDGDLDILTQYGGAGTAITFWANDGSGTFSNMGTGYFPASVTDVNIGNSGTTMGDVDNDGDVDIWIRVSGNNNDLLLQMDDAPPTITSTSPSNNATDIGWNANIELTLTNSTAVVKGQGTISILVNDGDGNFQNDVLFESFPVTDAKVTLSGSSSATTITINPGNTFAANTSYYVVIPAGAFLDGDSRGTVLFTGNRYFAGIPSPARALAFRNFAAITDKTLLSFTSSATASLPVGYTYFTVSLYRENALLQWQTTWEQNSKDFTIQHSIDGQSWKNIGKVLAAGNSSISRNYSFTHEQPVKGNNYYRILQADLDGRQSQSKIVSLTYNIGITPLRIYQQGQEMAVVELPSASASVIYVYNTNGQEVYHKNFNTNKATIPVNHYARGIYQVVVLQNGQRIVQSFYKQ